MPADRSGPRANFAPGTDDPDPEPCDECNGWGYCPGADQFCPHCKGSGIEPGYEPDYEEVDAWLT